MAATGPGTTEQDNRSLYLRPRVLTVGVLGFSSGLPLLLTLSTLSAWLFEQGVSKTEIGAFTLVGIAYAFKFVWAPLVDQAPLPGLTRLFGQRRSWLLFAQAACAAAIVGLAFTDPGADLLLTAGWAVAVAFFSATQDIAVDAYRVESLPEAEQAAGAAAYTLGYRLAMLLAGAGALFVAQYVDWTMAYLVMAAGMGIGMIAVLLAPEPVRPGALDPAGGAAGSADGPAGGPAGGRTGLAETLNRAVVAPFAHFVIRPWWWLILIFVAVFKYPDALLGPMANPFYLDIGFTKAEIATVSKTFGLGMTILGGFAGGWLVARTGLLRALVIAAVLQGASNLTYVGLALVGPQTWAFALTIAVENLSGGMAGVVFIAYLSSLCHVTFTATQYALLSSLAAFALRVFSSGGGWLADQVSWPAYFAITTVAAVPGLLLLWIMLRLFPADDAAVSTLETAPDLD